MLTFALKLILAHLIGDFLLQPQKWVLHKEAHKHKSKFLYFHILVHVLALIIILQFNFKYGLSIAIIGISHYVIDLIKLLLKSRFNNRLLFGLDQLAHLIIIALVVNLYYPFSIDFKTIFSKQTLLFITCILGVTQVSSIIMKTLISKWDVSEYTNQASLKNAGAYIGILERLFVFIFIITDHWEGVGFLITAKSVFRFSDLTQAKDRKLTEYILIGTLLSFGLAIAFGLGYDWVLKWI